MRILANVIPALILVSIVTDALVAPAQAATKPLKLVSSQVRTLLRQPVSVDLSLEGDHLRARFEVRAPSIYGKTSFVPKKDYPFQFDVVELFVTVDGNASNLPYSEFEVTPYGQTYEVRIDEKRKFEEGHFTGARYEASVVPGGWRAEIIVPLRNLGWDGDVSKIRGNAYAILGKPGHKTHWALSMPSMAKPNFHQPQHFVPLVGGR